jgi:hypothetical protein
MVGLALILIRLAVMPVTDSEWALMCGVALVGVIALMLRKREVDTSPPSPEGLDPDDASESAPCPSCHGVIPAGAASCPACGWTYRSSEL